mgnify:CR=1 FL=1
MSSESRYPRVLICDPIDDAGIEMLREQAEVEVKTDLSHEQLLAAVPDYEAIVVRSKTKVTSEVIEHGFNLKVIGRAGAGLDNIDVAAAREHGVAVVNSPDANTLAVAEHTLGLLLALARRLPRADVSLKSGEWAKKQLLGSGLAGKTLGIVGFGRIGRQVALRAEAFGMRVLVNQRRATPELDLNADVEPVDLSTLLERSDFVSLHVPLNDETRGLIGAEELARMKSSAYLINTARGAVIDEDALLSALDGGEIAGAALDVFNVEPPTDTALIQHERVIATPHIASSTEDAQRAAATTIAEAILDRLQDVEVHGVLPVRVVPVQQVFPHEQVDAKRLDRMAERLREECYLRNPPVVTETDEGYMVLDGATRLSAIDRIGCRDVVVQVAPPTSELDLGTWHHVICGIDRDALFACLNDLSLTDLVNARTEAHADASLEELLAYGGLCIVETVDGEAYSVQPRPNVDWIDALNELTQAYLAAATVSRTLETDRIRLAHQYSDMTAVVVFPEYSVSQVLQVAQTGQRFPAGITRFIIPERVLHVDVELDLLTAEAPLHEKNRQLHERLREKNRQGKIRYYAESIYLLDS